jgi:hypothetical protein
MTERLTSTQLLGRLNDLLTRVHDRGESFLIERDGAPIATLAPPPEPTGVTWRQFATLYGNLPRPDDGFADDLEAIHSAQAPIEPPEWPS